MHAILRLAVVASMAWSPLALAGFSDHGEDADGRSGTVAHAPPVAPASLTPVPAPSGTATVDAAVVDQDEPGPRDQVIPDDLIVQGSFCVGIDCVNNENFGFDTIRLKENNLRVVFDDTSVGDFPANDWALVANDSASGGASRFSIEDYTNALVPFTLRAGAPTNSLFLAATGKIGLRTGDPVLDLHFLTGNTPAIRLQQDNTNGFNPQTWDVAGNEANFFVRDVTSGSRLPFRIRPGAPTSSLDIAANGNVGIGTASPPAKLSVAASFAPAAAASALQVANALYPDPAKVRFEVDSDGNVFARGAISQLSSRSAKHAFDAIDGGWLLARLRSLPVTTWSYLASDARHAGPVAEDFHAAFGLGDTEQMIAPSDLAGVALAAVKALQDEVDERDRRIESLERRLAEIEARLSR